MPAYARGGVTTPTVTTPDGWPPEWTYPPADPPDPFNDDDEGGLWPPDWPRRLVDTGPLVIAASSTITAVVWQLDGTEPEDAADTVLTIPYSVSVTGAGDYVNHRMVIQAGWDGARGRTRSTGVIVTLDGTNQTFTGNLATTLKFSDITDSGGTMKIRARVYTVRDQPTDDHDIILGGEDPVLGVTGACTGDTLGCTVGLVDAQSAFTVSEVTSADFVEE